MNKIIGCLILTAAIANSVFAQTPDEKDSLGVINTMFTEMANHNPAAIAVLFTKDSNLTALIKTKDGKSGIRVFTGETFSKNFAEKRGEIKEDMYAPEVKVYGDLALVYGRYVFFSDNKISHCGVNAFHLARTENGWKIVNASSTIEPQGCTEQEKKRTVSE